MQRSTCVGRRYTSAQRDKILAAYQHSQLTQKEFAAQAGVGYSTLTLWLRQALAAPNTAASTFVPVPNLFSAASGAPAYRLQFPRGLILEVAAGFRAEELQSLLQLVRTL